MSTDIFNKIAARYDAMNYILSFGMDISWRKKMLLFLPQRDGLRVLDLAAGTADVTIALAKDPRVRCVTGVDLSNEMLAIGKDKAARAGVLSKVVLKQEDALQLTFSDGSFDALTVAFGLRNFSDLMQGLMEAYRVINKGGRLIVLEFSTPTKFPQRYFHGVYLKYILPWLGMILAGHRGAYAHLARTAAVFPSGERFCRIIRQVGFSRVDRYELAMGAATIYVAWREEGA